MTVAEHLLRAGAQVITVDKAGVTLKAASDSKRPPIEHKVPFNTDRSSAAPEPDGVTVANTILALTTDRGLTAPSIIVHNVVIDAADDLSARETDDAQRAVVSTLLDLTRTLANELLRAQQQPPGATSERAAVLFVTSVPPPEPSRDSRHSDTAAVIEPHMEKLALELGPSGIRVNAITAGLIRADRGATTHQVPLGGPGTPEDVARVALWLLSDHWAGYLTGVNLPVDGGLSVDTWVPPLGEGW